MKILHRLFIALALLPLLAACASAPAAEELHATAQFIASTNIALTIAALPTGTPLPTQTNTPEPTATSTAQQSATQSVTQTSAATVATAVPNATATQYGMLSGDAQATAWADKDDRNAPLMLRNRTEEEIHLIIVSPVYGEYVFTRDMSLILPENTYTYRAWVGDKAFSGSFSITNGDKHALVFYSDHVRFGVP
jgi:hypothetical protein